MPVKESIKPQDPTGLQQKITAGKVEAVVQDVQTHLNRWGSASYQAIMEGTKDVSLPSRRCVIFLITGKFQVRGVEVATAGEGHMVEDEATIQLQSFTAVVIINQV